MTVIEHIICCVLRLMAIIPCSSGLTLQGMFATSKSYANYKLVTEEPSFVLASLAYTGSIQSNGVTCAQECFRNSKCVAFNFFPNGSSYTCQLLADNFCLSMGNLYLQSNNGSLIYDKLQPGTKQSCFDKVFSNVQASSLCGKLKYGCTGTWPNCGNCVQTCIDCYSRYSYSGKFNCTIWPGGASTQPVFAKCFNDILVLMKSSVDMATGGVTRYMMPLADMNRVVALKAYSMIQFYARETITEKTFYAQYNNPSIDKNGTLSNLRFVSSSPINGVDLLGLSGGALSPSPFIWVANDTPTNCGSFWLLKSTHALNCPGGSINVFGTVKVVSGQVTDTGIHLPGASGKVLEYGDVALLK